MLIIGERINTSRKSIALAVSSKDAAFLQAEARAQAAAGADYIDVNAGTFVDDEAERLIWLVELVQEAVDLPLCIDSPDPAVIKSVLPALRRRPMINSITLEPSRLGGILPLVIEYKAKVIALCQSEEMVADTVELKVRMAGELVAKVTDAGVPLEDLYIDSLVYPLATNFQSALASLGAIEQIMKGFPGVHTTCGLTNVSYGLPARKLVNSTFLVAAIVRGLDSAILDPVDKRLYSTLRAALLIAGKDPNSVGYIRAFREQRIE
jgi:5-methyltetrahydrofolate corrinoid/iron sulfur protein methyltransferase